MQLHTQYERVVNQLLHCLRHDFNLGDGAIDFIDNHITGTDAFRNDVLAAHRVLGGWHQSLADVGTDIVECGRGSVSHDLLAAFAQVVAGALYLLAAKDSSRPQSSPIERYESALAMLTELNKAAAEIEAEFLNAPQQLQL